jgi:hypothetical protein
VTKFPTLSTYSTNRPSIFDRGTNEAAWAVDRYLRELFRITHANNIPSDWASPDQRCRARNVYDHVLEVLKRNHGRKLREVMDAEIDISDVIQ